MVALTVFGYKLATLVDSVVAFVGSDSYNEELFFQTEITLVGAELIRI